MSFISVAIKITLAAFLGGFIGFEREVHRHEAGLRTHILVSLGSTLIMLTSIYIFDIYKGIATVDPSRIAASIMTGIGFIGAGAIIRYGTSIRGLTTAASLWITAAVGMAIGCGFYSAAIFSTIVTIVVLSFLRKFERELLQKKDHTENRSLN